MLIVLNVSNAAFDEIENKLREAGYVHCFCYDENDEYAIDLSGVGVCREIKEHTQSTADLDNNDRNGRLTLHTP